MRIFLMITFCTFLLLCKAQGDRTTYINKVKTICPDADIIEIETKDDFIEIEYLCDKKVVEVGLGFDLKIIYRESETTIDNKTLEKIHKKLDKKYFGWTIDEFSLVETPDTNFYKAEILRDGIEENLYFTLDGKYYKTKNIVLNESWNIASLEKSEFYNKSNYNLTRPDKTYEMPEILVEISGIAVLNETDIFCIQDEAGIVFRYNTQNEELSGMYRFTDVGDFEDITIQNEMVNILRSDGTVFSLNYGNYTGKSEFRNLPLNCMNAEGLFYDNTNNRFLIVCKDQLINQESSLRHVFSLNSVNSTLPEIEFVIDLKEINAFIYEHYKEIDNKIIKLNPSSISVHPITGEIFVLSASNRLLAIYKNHQLKNIYPLAEELFYKPEGISFGQNGDMYISTEGNKKGYVGGQIHYFKMMK
ncbi:MAG: hypothetical protein JXJ22_04230 [Bacteroidales bacterium]|nr:hypothetical protein [Bacteroidales bacterium]